MMLGSHDNGSTSGTLIWQSERWLNYGETAETERVQAVFRELLRKFGRRAELTADFREDTERGMLAAFCRRQAEMLGRAKVRFHSGSRQSKTEHQSFGGLVTAPGQSPSTAHPPAWATILRSPGDGALPTTALGGPAPPPHTPSTPPISPELTQGASRPGRDDGSGRPDRMPA